MSLTIDQTTKIVQIIVLKLIDRIDNLMNIAPKIKESDEFSASYKPKVSLSSLGYDYKKFGDADIHLVLESVKTYMNQKLNSNQTDEESGIYIDYEDPSNKSASNTYLNSVHEQLKKNAGIPIIKNNDYVFTISFA